MDQGLKDSERQVPEFQSEKDRHRGTEAQSKTKSSKVAKLLSERPFRGSMNTRHVVIARPSSAVVAIRFWFFLSLTAEN